MYFPDFEHVHGCFVQMLIGTQFSIGRNLYCRLKNNFDKRETPTIRGHSSLEKLFLYLIKQSKIPPHIHFTLLCM